MTSLLLILAACSGSDESSDTTKAADTTEAPGATDAPAMTDIRLGWGNMYAQTPRITLAQRDDLFAVNGLDVEVIPFITGRDSLTALIGGQVDYAVMAEYPAVIAAIQGEDLSVIADLSTFSDYKVMTRTDTGISTLADLEGRKVGVPVGTNMQFALEEALNSVGLETSDIEEVALPVTGLAGALAKGDIDAAMPFDTFYLGFAEALGDRYAEVPYDGYSLHFLLVAAPGMSSDVSKRFLQALKDAEPQLSDPEQAKADILEFGGDNVNSPYVESAFDAWDFSMDLSQDLVDLMVAEGQWLIKTQGLEGEPTEDLFRSIIDPEPLEAVAPGSSDL